MSAFDALAPTYDSDFTESVIARHLRERTHTRLLSRFKTEAISSNWVANLPPPPNPLPAGREGESCRAWRRGKSRNSPRITENHVLELGCGTGEDARLLASHGIRVTATDSSANMIEIARRKTADQPLVNVLSLNLANPDPGFMPDTLFNGAFSNFGAINCVEDRSVLASWLANRVKIGGVIALGVMSPLCVWEMLWHGAHLEFKIAFRRQKPGGVMFVTTSGNPIPIFYPTIAQITREFEPHFKRVHVEPLGVFLPPTAGYNVVEKRLTLLRTLMRLDDSVGRLPMLSLFADHYWIEFERV